MQNNKEKAHFEEKRKERERERGEKELGFICGI
jgi:hypothetical protein